MVRAGYKCEDQMNVDINRRRYQHSYDLRTYNQLSPLISHLHKEGHMIKIDNFETLKYIRNHSFRRFYESFAIKNSINFNRDIGNYKIDNFTNNYLKQSSSCDNIKHTLEEWAGKNELKNKTTLFSTYPERGGMKIFHES